MSDRPPHSLCVLAEPYLRDYQVRSIERAIETAGVDVPLVVVNDQEDREYDPETEAKAVNGRLGRAAVRLFRSALANERAWALAIAEKKLAEEVGAREPAPTRRHIDDIPCFDGAEVRRVRPLRDGSWYELPAGTVEQIRESCDVAVRYGFGLIRGDILTTPEYGLLSFHPADIRRYRGLGPPQAFLDGRDVMGVTLQRLSSEIDAGEIVAYEETDVSDCATLWEIYDRLHDIQAGLLATGIRNLRAPSTDVTVPDSLGSYRSITERRHPSFAGRVVAKNMRGRIDELLS
jgi:hypothetical protein